MQGHALDLISFAFHLFGSSEIDICGGQVVQCLMVAAMVVVIHEAPDLALKLGGAVVVL